MANSECLSWAVLHMLPALGHVLLFLQETCGVTDSMCPMYHQDHSCLQPQRSCHWSSPAHSECSWVPHPPWTYLKMKSAAWAPTLTVPGRAAWGHWHPGAVGLANHQPAQSPYSKKHQAVFPKHIVICKRKSHFDNKVPQWLSGHGAAGTKELAEFLPQVFLSGYCISALKTCSGLIFGKQDPAR